MSKAIAGIVSSVTIGVVNGLLVYWLTGEYNLCVVTGIIVAAVMVRADTKCKYK